jgi:hypothetical protein
VAILSLGVLDVAYTQDEGNGISHTTTGKVAQILEDNYHIMATFFALRDEQIAGFLADAMAQAFSDKVNGRTVGGSPMADAEQRIEAEFRAFIFSNEINTLSMAVTSTPISAAAARGVNKRKMHPYAKANKARPAFVDTGLYVASFRALFKPTGVQSGGARDAIQMARAQKLRAVQSLGAR